MILPIYIYGTDVLRTKSKEVTPDYEGLEKLISDMFETMYASDGVGLAAPQIGRAIRLFVVDASVLKDDFPETDGFKRVFINPEILWSSEEKVSMSEGCLSLPGISEQVTRPVEVKIRYQDEHFETHEETLKGFNARVFQHEFDHIEQTLFTDRISPMRKQMVKRKLQKLAKGIVDADYPTVTK
ncbi:MAG: peptide deformylase [Porphyromonas sp.]|nr:peptide deformylase [Porphyromonas sp.]